jgi:hypothetical protein
MNFLEEVEPYRTYIDMYLDKGAMPNLKIREELSDLDYRLRMHERVAMYGKANIELYPTDMACASCVKSMVNNLRRWINIKEAEEKEMIKKTALEMVGWTDKFPEEETVEFKGVPQVNKKDMEVLPKDFSKESVDVVERMSQELEFEGTLEEKVENLNSLSNQIAEQMINDLKLPSEMIAGYKVIDLTKMKWGAFKSYCKSKGLNVKGKTRAQLTEELTSL